MLKTEKKLIITFATTTDIISAEKVLKKGSSEHIGEIVPLPSKISAGCGLAWSASTDKKEKILELLKNDNIKYDKIYEIEI